MTQVWGHRGYARNYPENTLVSFEAALLAGAEGIELDVHRTSDGEFVVIHDARLDRTTDGSGFVHHTPWSSLARLNAAVHFPHVGPQSIPTLTEVLAMVQTRFPQARINVELKNETGALTDMEGAVYDLVTRYGLEGQVLFSSFDHVCLQRLRKARPTAAIGLLYGERLVDPWRYAAFLQANALHPLRLTVDEQVVREAHQQNVAIHVWTVNDDAELRSFFALGVDAIITDDPATALEVRRQMHAQNRLSIE